MNPKLPTFPTFIYFVIKKLSLLSGRFPFTDSLNNLAFLSKIFLDFLKHLLGSNEHPVSIEYVSSTACILAYQRRKMAIATTIFPCNHFVKKLEIFVQNFEGQTFNFVFFIPKIKRVIKMTDIIVLEMFCVDIIWYLFHD